MPIKTPSFGKPTGAMNCAMLYAIIAVPNPVRPGQTIQLSAKGLDFPAMLTLYDMTGRAVFSKSVAASEGVAAPLEAGAYRMLLLDAAGRAVSGMVVVE